MHFKNDKQLRVLPHCFMPNLVIPHLSGPEEAQPLIVLRTLTFFEFERKQRIKNGCDLFSVSISS